MGDRTPLASPRSRGRRRPLGASPGWRAVVTVGISVLLAVALTGCNGDDEPATETAAGTAAPPETPGETLEETPGQATTGSTGTVDDEGTDTESAEDDSATTPISAEEEVRELAQRWYTETDPAVCEEMTADFLRAVYGAGGAEGREACAGSVTQPPLENVQIGAAEVGNDRATVDAMYRVDGREVVDRLGIVQRNGRWLLDSYETLPG